MKKLALLLTMVLLGSCASTPTSPATPPVSPTLPDQGNGELPETPSGTTRIEGRVPADLTSAARIVGNETTTSPDVRADHTFSVELYGPDRVADKTFPVLKWLQDGLPQNAQCSDTVPQAADLKVAWISEFLVQTRNSDLLGIAYKGTERTPVSLPPALGDRAQIGTIAVWLYASQDHALSGEVRCRAGDANLVRTYTLQLQSGWNELRKKTTLEANTLRETWQNNAEASEPALSWQFQPGATPCLTFSCPRGSR